MKHAPELPLVASLLRLSPLDALDALSDLPHAFLLHSGLAGPRARWSFFGADPFAWFRGREYDEALGLWRRLAATALPVPAAPAPFTGGAVGYWAYDFGRRLERLPAIARDDLGLPDVVLGFYDVVGALDHATGAAWVVSSGLPLEGRARAARAAARLEAFARRFAAPASVARAAWAPGEALSTFDRAGYVAAVERVKDHIRRGDIFQANLSQRWTARVTPPPRVPDAPAAALARDLFGALARLSPAPHAAYLDAGDHAVVSASPERFLELRGARVETRPIKGTRPRGRTPAADAALLRELEGSAKDRAENVMIVDVLRNDLGRVCATGSVRTTALCELESFPQVFHLTSTVTGDLGSGLDAIDLLHACFPGGSITGAPKIRAMEIIERLEPVRRHLYTGAIGYLDWRGDADWCIAIRSALVTPGTIRFAAGGGITADSDPEAEYEETLHKAAGLRAALEDLAAPHAEPGAVPSPERAADPPGAAAGTLR
jgi:para-aminobenzoate synthetase component 1